MKTIPKENFDAVPLSNANKEDVSKAVEDLPPDWYEKEVQNFAGTSFDSKEPSGMSKIKQTEGNKNLELKVEKVNDEESNSDESIDADKQFFVSQIHRERELTKVDREKICVQGRKNGFMKHFKSLNSQ